MLAWSRVNGADVLTIPNLASCAERTCFSHWALGTPMGWLRWVVSGPSLLQLL